MTREHQGSEEMRSTTKKRIIGTLKKLGDLQPGKQNLSNMDTLYMRKAVVLLEDAHTSKPVDRAMSAYCKAECGAPDDCIGDKEEFTPCEPYKQFKKLLEVKEE